MRGRGEFPLHVPLTFVTMSAVEAGDRTTDAKPSRNSCHLHRMLDDAETTTAETAKRRGTHRFIRGLQKHVVRNPGVFALSLCQRPSREVVGTAAFLPTPG